MTAMRGLGGPLILAGGLFVAALASSRGAAHVLRGARSVAGVRDDALVARASRHGEAPSRAHEAIGKDRDLQREPLLLDAAVRSTVADTTIVIKATGSTLEFVPPRLSVRTGTRVVLRFVNEGTLPHNFVLPQVEDDIDALALAAYESAESGYVPVAQKEKLVAYTKLVSPGETAEVTFTVPAPGEYTYVCLFPGHANTMLGTLRALR